MAPSTTAIVNETQGPLKIQVGNNRNYVDLATVEKDGKYTMKVDVNATYQEYFMGTDTAGNKLIVSSDDCCDYKNITIKENDGKFVVHKEPRSSVASTPAPTMVPTNRAVDGPRTPSRSDLHKVVPMQQAMGLGQDGANSISSAMKKPWKFNWKFWSHTSPELL